MKGNIGAHLLVKDRYKILECITLNLPYKSVKCFKKLKYCKFYSKEIAKKLEDQYGKKIFSTNSIPQFPERYMLKNLIFIRYDCLVNWNS